jgi:hypothetical protein
MSSIIPALTPDQAAAVSLGKAAVARIEEARVMGDVRLLYDVGGPDACMRVLLAGLEYVRDRMQQGPGVIGQGVGGLG